MKHQAKQERANTTTRTKHGTGLVGITLVPFGNAQFKNSEHNGYYIYSFGVKIGKCNAFESKRNIENTVNTDDTVFGSKNIQKWIGGVEIFEEAKYLFEGFNFPTYESTRKNTLSASDHKKATKGARKRKKVPVYTPVR